MFLHNAMLAAPVAVLAAAFLVLLAEANTWAGLAATAVVLTIATAFNPD